jgi:hypothetical protein
VKDNKMTNNEDIIKLTALLTKATMLLFQARDDKQFAIKSLQVPFAEKKELSKETIQWLMDKNEKSINDIELLVCQAEKFLFPCDCNEEELLATHQVPTEDQQLAIDAIMSNSKLVDKIIQITKKDIK